MNDRERRAWAIEQACLMLHSATPSDVCNYAEELLNWVMGDTPKSDEDGWIEHDGKGTPALDESTMVEVRWRNGHSATAPVIDWEKGEYNWWDWRDTPPIDRILAYRVVTE